MIDLSYYIKVITSPRGCNSHDSEQFKCNRYLDCESCIKDKIKEHDKQIKADVIEEYKNALLKLIQDEQATRYGYLNEMDIREIAEKIIKINE